MPHYAICWTCRICRIFNSHNCTMPYRTALALPLAHWPCAHWRLWQLQSFHLTWWHSWALSSLLSDIIQSTCETSSEANQTAKSHPSHMFGAAFWRWPKLQADLCWCLVGLQLGSCCIYSCCTYTLRICVQLAQKFAVTLRGIFGIVVSVFLLFGFGQCQGEIAPIIDANRC